MANNEYREPHQADVRKTPDEWCAILGYEILDPDGWRGSSGRPWTDPITRIEFEARLVTCTQRVVDPRKEFRAEQQERRNHGLKARHETRQERAIRRQVAEEIAQALEAVDAMRAASSPAPYELECPGCLTKVALTVRELS